MEAQGTQATMALHLTGFWARAFAQFLSGDANYCQRFLKVFQYGTSPVVSSPVLFLSPVDCSPLSVLWVYESPHSGALLPYYSFKVYHFGWLVVTFLYFKGVKQLVLQTWNYQPVQQTPPQYHSDNSSEHPEAATCGLATSSLTPLDWWACRKDDAILKRIMLKL